MSGEGAGTTRFLTSVKELCLGYFLPITLCLAIGQIQAQNPGQERTVTALHVESTITVDGELDEPAWSLAEPAANLAWRHGRVPSQDALDLPVMEQIRRD